MKIYIVSALAIALLAGCGAGGTAIPQQPVSTTSTQTQQASVSNTAHTESENPCPAGVIQTQPNSVVATTVAVGAFSNPYELRADCNLGSTPAQVYGPDAPLVGGYTDGLDGLYEFHEFTIVEVPPHGSPDILKIETTSQGETYAQYNINPMNWQSPTPIVFAAEGLAIGTTSIKVTSNVTGASMTLPLTVN